MTPEQLKASILQRAMEGKLVPQNPNDEPASELLKRIKAEKKNLSVKEKSNEIKRKLRYFVVMMGNIMGSLLMEALKKLMFLMIFLILGSG
ncbi:type I restriction-modification system, S subunit [Streptococcus pneumoniae GA19451]|nr:type I restriction-modification system, S subunit [Streptococcus pneumoniae GA19451]VQJ59372.1 type I restriction enzyme [Streptococcus pneumoniae]